MCDRIQRYSRAAESEASDRDERLLREIHRLCCLIADKDNGMGTAPLRTIAQEFAALREEACSRNETAEAIYGFGYGFALLRASAFQETIPLFERISEDRVETLQTIGLAASCDQRIARRSKQGELP